MLMALIGRTLNQIQGNNEVTRVIKGAPAQQLSDTFALQPDILHHEIRKSALYHIYIYIYIHIEEKIEF